MILRGYTGKPVIAIDFDDTLFDFNASILRWHNRMYGTRLTLEDFRYYEMDRVWGGTRDEAIAKVGEFHSSGASMLVEPVPGAVEAVCLLAEMHDLMVPTSRHQGLEDMSVELLFRYFPPVFAEFITCNQYVTSAGTRCKGELCRDRQAFSLIDDSIHHIGKAVEAGVALPILFGDYAWNREVPPGSERMVCWKDVLSRFFAATSTPG